MLKALDDGNVKCESGLDVRNYGIVDGIPECKKLFSEILDIAPEKLIVFGNASLTIMYDYIAQCMIFGAGAEPWCKQGNIKFLCPVPGYDRHFAICEFFGIKMVNIPLDENGPDMDMVESLVASDETIKGMWCVPKYANPLGCTYSAETVRRIASLKPKAKDFRVFWDNAYAVHELYEDGDVLADIFEACERYGNVNRVIYFASTSKISFPGAGVAIFAVSEENMAQIKAVMTIQTIGFDKINQLRHVKFFKNADGIRAHMDKLADIIRPKFESVLNQLETIKDTGIARWTNPKGGYFISLDVMEGCAKRVEQLCANAGMILTPAGATYPYGNDLRDRNIRIAPTYPCDEDLKVAMHVFTVCVKLAAVEKLISEKNA